MQLASRMTRFALLTGTALALAVTSASAARIYNQTYVPIIVKPSPPFHSTVTVSSGQRSESINWTAGLSVIVTTHRPKRQGQPGILAARAATCTLNFGGHAHLQGGNYLVVSQKGRTITCTLCDSKNKAIQQSTGEFGPTAPSFTSASPGC